jgi:uncharacterized protein (TIGR03083 family)
MEKNRCIAALLADSAALAEAARLDLDAAVPSCPGWSVADLVEHTGRVHRSVTRRVRDLEAERRAAADVQLPARAELIGWFEQGVNGLARVLEAAEPDAPVWNWSAGPKVASFWWRRMAQETAVHRWDGQSAHGRQQPIAADVAADGIAEFFEVYLPTDFAEKPPTDLGGTLALRCTDLPDAWLVTVLGGALIARRDRPSRSGDPAGAGPGDAPLATVSASASDLLLLLWRRIPPTAPEITTDGDAALLARFAALADLD